MRRSSQTRGFTLIELTVVISIILILAALFLNAGKYVQDKARRDRAHTEIAALEAALESFKSDNGAYPTSSISVAAVTFPNPKASTVDYQGYIPGAEVLYQVLSGKTDMDTVNANQKVYMEFKANQVDPVAKNFLIDPWKHPYGYNHSQSTNASGDNYDLTSTSSFNTNFVDLWSTAGLVDGATIVPAKLVANWPN